MADALARIAARPELNAVITACEEQALARARAGVQRRRWPACRCSIKDLIDTAGVRTTYGSSIYADHVPRAQRPLGDGARGAGRDRRGQGEPRRVRVGRVRPEHVLRRHRQPDRARPRGRRLEQRQRGRARRRDGPAGARAPTPAARCASPPRACGVVGLKTALGAVPTEGVFPLAASFDTVGPMARTVADCALAHAVLTATEVPAPAIDGPARRRADRLSGPRAAPTAPAAARRARAGPRRCACARSAPTCASSRCRCRRATRGRSSTPTPPPRTRPPSRAGATSTGR